MKQIRRIGVAGLVTVLTICAVTGCTKTDKQDTSQDTNQNIQEEKIDYSNLTVEDITMAYCNDVEGIETPEITITPSEIPDTEALNFTKDMAIGWNLGNTLDATVGDAASLDSDVETETAWGAVTTTKEMIDAVKEAGFNTLRLPVSWHNHVEGDDYIISEAWLARVKEIVDYAYENDMYVILNTHHDCDTEYLYPSSQYLEQSIHFLECIWSQVAEYFKDYDEHLIFEGFNEVRLKDTSHEWWFDSGNAECKDAADCINQMNQAFVNTVRTTGGENAERYLMVSAYCASLGGATATQFSMPTDSAESRLILSVHAYLPYYFALAGETDSKSTDEFSITESADTRDIDSTMKTIYEKFIQNGIPVVIGEFGSRDKSGNLQARVDCAAYYVAAARTKGITCCWWDNNAFSGDGENFGLLYRFGMNWIQFDIVQALMKYAR